MWSISPVRAAAASAVLLLCVWAGTAADTPEQRIAELCKAGSLREAATVACEWASVEPGSIPALRACAELGGTVGLHARAEEALRSLLFYTPSDPETLVMLGKVLIDRGRYVEAREQFEAAIHLTGTSAAAYAGLARAAIYEAESSGDILSAAEVAVAIAPEYAPAHAAMGAALREVGRLEEAIEALQRAREIDPGDPASAFDLGLTLAMMGEEERAREAWERYVALEPYSPETWLLRNGLIITGIEEVLDRAFDAQYSPDGTRIAYRGRGEGGWGVYTIPAEGEPVETRLWATEANLQSLAWSPDSSQIAVTVMERQQTADGKQEWTRKLLLIPAEGGEAKLVLEDRNLGEVGWNPGTGRIGARSYARRQGYSIVEIDPQTGESTPVAGLSGPSLDLTPTWSRDGSMLLTARRTGPLPDETFAYDLMVGPANDFGSAKAIYRAASQPRGPVFSPDGSVILLGLAGTGSARLNIWAIPADGSRDPVLVDHRGGSYVTPSLSPDGRFLLTSRETMLYRATLSGLARERTEG